ncbi:TRF2-interacting telomeric protein/Rap1 C terminal domain-containing protein [Xylaria bambusicola]|uniref:TRF2-interacting telomeric protein/Rap1 C terminal domain-containing protein n=1 Tax=Xylaria bambusicola TaxID=326684 RepID=UPI002008A968|nr:TRF2-interacting telomeric protein/Rap1 C terminal domain-containing protein [Xylaria bambusicola]KAI0518065.1 TRF2-interacting telomeric protein/Rap1 C terminal domain-containing protein [Xylaria bambusicola]
MSAPGITYSGVLAEKGANSSTDVGAGVFRGLKFWVTARVPHRKACVDTIEKNGGTVILKEGNADLLICDPAKQPVPGSYSYQLVSDAIKEGSLDSKDNYLCESLAASSGISNKPAPKTKLTRVAFTEDDDSILTKYVLEMERLGYSTSGNEIYRQFAEEHTRHTWQSWRDRWAKKLKNLPHPSFSDRDQSPKVKTAAVAPSQGVTASSSPVARSRARFTTEEDEILLETIHHAIENHEAWNGYPPYKRLASELPQRTYSSWRDRALNHVARQYKDQIAQWEFEAGFSPSDNADPPVDGVDSQGTPTTENKSEVTVQSSGNLLLEAAGSPKETDPHKSVGVNGSLQDRNAASSAIHGLRSPETSTGLKHTLRSEALSYSASSPILRPPESIEDSLITTEGQFYRDYNTFLDTVGIAERQIPTIRGKAISLWGLWQSVRSKKVEITELDWQQIAEDLGFDWVSMETVPEELQQCYEEHLAPFADAVMNFNDSSEDEEVIEGDADVETDALLPSSPPVLPSLKRSFPPSSSAFVLQTSPKRRRIDRTHEIPSTPEHEERMRNLRSSIGPSNTPTKSRLGHSIVTEPAMERQAQSSARDAGEITDRLGHTQGQKRQVEPETQDFRFGPDTQAHSHGEGPDDAGSDSDRDTTPSQQLRLESDSASPKIKQNNPILTSPGQGIVQFTPAPNHKIRVPFQLDDSDEDVVQRSNKESGNTCTSLPTEQAQPKRRTLPSSFLSKSPGSLATLHNDQTSSAPVPETEPRRRPSPPQETPDDIIDRFVSLGYGKDIVLRSLKATSWIIGNAGQVMEMLKQGEPLPPRTTGVWTQRDDDSLALVYSKAPPSTAKEEKKQQKEMKRLQAKHGAEQIALRKQYLLDELPE